MHRTYLQHSLNNAGIFKPKTEMGCNTMIHFWSYYFGEDNVLLNLKRICIYGHFTLLNKK